MNEQVNALNLAFVYQQQLPILLSLLSRLLILDLNLSLKLNIAVVVLFAPGYKLER